MLELNAVSYLSAIGSASASESRIAMGCHDGPSFAALVIRRIHSVSWQWVMRRIALVSFRTNCLRSCPEAEPGRN